MTAIGFGVDLSHHQPPAVVPWEKFPGVVDFVICRASYGGGLRDRAVVEHMRRARQTGAKVGLYQFHRPTQSVESHVEMFKAVAGAVDLREGDIVPAVDIELDPLPSSQPVEPSWEPHCRELCERVAELWGNCMIYITAREWRFLGSPAWVLKRPLWVSHFTASTAPASPGGAVPVIWQHRIGKFDPRGPGGYDVAHPDFDQDRQLLSLPLIGTTGEADILSDSERARIGGLVALTLDQSARENDGPDVGQRMRWA